MLKGTHTFKPANLLVGMSGYPVINEQDNGDGTFQGHVDLENATASQKLFALANLKHNANKALLGI